VAEAVGEVAAGVEGHAHDALGVELPAQVLPVVLGEVVDGLGAETRERRRLDAVRQDRPVRDEVGVDAGVRLDVGVLGPEQLPRVLGGDALDGVDVLTAGVEAVPDRALGVLVAQPGAHRQQHRQRRVVLARDELQRTSLVCQLLLRRRGDPRFDRSDDLEDLAVRAAGNGGDVAHGLLPDRGWRPQPIGALVPVGPVTLSAAADPCGCRDRDLRGVVRRRCGPDGGFPKPSPVSTGVGVAIRRVAAARELSTGFVVVLSQDSGLRTTTTPVQRWGLPSWALRTTTTTVDRAPGLTRRVG